MASYPNSLICVSILLLASIFVQTHSAPASGSAASDDNILEEIFNDINEAINGTALGRDFAALISDIETEFLDVIQEARKELNGTFLGSVIDDAENNLADFLKGVESELNEVIRNIVNTYNRVSQYIDDSNLAKGLEAIGKDLEKILADGFEDLKTAANNVDQLVTDVVQEVRMAIKDLIKGLVSAASDLADHVETAFNESPIGQGIDDVTHVVGEGIDDAAKAVGTGVEDAKKAIAALVKSILGDSSSEANSAAKPKVSNGPSASPSSGTQSPAAATASSSSSGLSSSSSLSAFANSGIVGNLDSLFDSMESLSLGLSGSAQLGSAPLSAAGAQAKAKNLSAKLEGFLKNAMSAGNKVSDFVNKLNNKAPVDTPQQVEVNLTNVPAPAAA